MAKTQFDDCVKKVRLFATEKLREELRIKLTPAQINSMVHEIL
jgi:hypothetical protein